MSPQGDNFCHPRVTKSKGLRRQPILSSTSSCPAPQRVPAMTRHNEHGLPSHSLSVSCARTPPPPEQPRRQPSTRQRAQAEAKPDTHTLDSISSASGAALAALALTARQLVRLTHARVVAAAWSAGGQGGRKACSESHSPQQMAAPASAPHPTLILLVL